VFQQALPSFMSGIDLVLSSPTQTFTLRLADGAVTIVGKGDLHDTSHDADKRVISNSVKRLIPGAITDYTITVYPTKDFYNSYVTNLPLIVSLTEVGAVIITLLLVLLYMYGVSKRDAAMIHAIESSLVMADYAKEELEIKKNFVRYISHEIRTPLNTVKMGLEVLKQDMMTNMKKSEGNRGGKESAYLRTVGDIVESVQAALEVVNDFLLFDKIVSNKLALEFVPVDVVDLINSVAQSFQIQARRCGTSLTVVNEVNNTGIKVSTDRHKVTQVLRNMISNGLKFTPSGGKVTVLIRKVVDALREGESCYVIEVADTGVGISLENQAKLFKDIVQFNPGKLQAGGGSGLGMYISHSIMTQLEGSMSVHSEGEGLGTTFTIKLPIIPVKSCPRASLARQNSGKSPQIEVGGQPFSTAEVDTSNSGDAREEKEEASYTMDILVVDDAVSNRKMLCRMIQVPLNCRCDEAGDGKQAVELVKQRLLIAAQGSGDTPASIAQSSTGRNRNKPYDVVLMDYTMPNMTGPEAAKAMRNNGYKGLIIGITGHADEQAEKTFLSNGANRVLVKPVELTLIKTALEELMSSVVEEF